MTNDELRNRSLNEGLVTLTHTLHDLAKLDPSAEALHSQSTDILYALEELTSAVRAYRDRIDFDPQHIEAIEDRITVLRNLQRKYRAPVDELIPQAEAASTEIERLEHSAEHIEALKQKEQELKQQLGTLASPTLGKTSCRRKRITGGRRTGSARPGDAAHSILCTATSHTQRRWRLCGGCIWQHRNDCVVIVPV